jgi:uncharacterized membrane protein YfcA
LTLLASATLGLSPAALLFAGLAILAAGFIRGFTGFGFALLAVPALSLLVEPAIAVPCSLVLQTLASTQQIGKVWRSADWVSVRPLLIGAAVGSPLGLWGLSTLPAGPMRIVIGAVVLAAAVLLWRGGRLPHGIPAPATLGVGALSGLLNGATAMGGPPVVVYYLALPVGVAVGRASLMVFFLFVSLLSLVLASAAGLVGVGTLLFCAVMLAPMLVGNWLGDRFFARGGGAHYRRAALAVLLVAGVLAIARGVV